MAIIQMRGAKEAPREDRSSMETMLLTPDVVANWRLPPCQRPLHVNKKVLEIAEKFKTSGGIVSGVIWLARVGNDRTTLYLYDGQHRLEAAKISGLKEFIADVGIRHFDTLAELGVEFVNLNSHIKNLTPDDKLRALEGVLPELQRIRKHCPFVAYGSVRRNSNTNCPTLSMSVALRAWHGSSGETPTRDSRSAVDIATSLTQADAEELIQFLNIARVAWGADTAYARMWGGLNLTMTMWLWRQLVLTRPVDKRVKRHVVVNADQYRKCLMSLSASGDYVEWLVGRAMTERDRMPAFNRIRSIFLKRLHTDGFTKPYMPHPAWSTN